MAGVKFCVSLVLLNILVSVIAEKLSDKDCKEKLADEEEKCTDERVKVLFENCGSCYSGDQPLCFKKDDAKQTPECEKCMRDKTLSMMAGDDWYYCLLYGCNLDKVSLNDEKAKEAASGCVFGQLIDYCPEQVMNYKGKMEKKNN